MSYWTSIPLLCEEDLSDIVHMHTFLIQSIDLLPHHHENGTTKEAS